jgi:hypothetical protein
MSRLNIVLSFMELYNFILGLDLSVLRAIHNLVQEKTSKLHVWKGKKKLKEKYIGKVYIEVSKVFFISMVTRYLLVLL